MWHEKTDDFTLCRFIELAIAVKTGDDRGDDAFDLFFHVFSLKFRMLEIV